MVQELSKNRLQDKTYNIIANGRTPLGTNINKLTVKSTTQNFDIEIDGQKISMEALDEIEFDEVISDIVLIDTSGSGTVCTLTLGRGKFIRRRISGSVTIASSSTVDSKADVSVGSLSAISILTANASRISAVINNTHATTTIRVGDSGVDSALGIPVPAGGGVVLDTTAELFAYNPGGTAVPVAVTELNA